MYTSATPSAPTFLADSRALSSFSRKISPDDGVRELETFPFAPGESPFRIKGVAYRGHVEYVQRHVPGGMAAVHARTRNPDIVNFFEKTNFLASSLYDVVPLAYAGMPCAEVVGLPFLGFVQQRTQMQVEYDTDGVYRGLLAMVGVNALVKRLPQLVSQYTNFANVKIEWAQGDMIVTRHDAIPRAIAPWWVAVTDTYVRIAAKRVGAKNVDVQYDRPLSAGSAHGVPLVSIDVTAFLK